MRVSVEKITVRILPEKLANRLQPALQIADAVLSGTDDNARAQRMAMLVFIIRVASAVIAFVSQVLLARWLGMYQYGVFVAVWVALIIAGSIVGIGFPAGIIRLIAEYRQKQEPGLLRGAIRAAMQITTAFSTLVAIAATFILYYYPELVKAYYLAPVYLAIICVPMLSIEGMMDGISRAFNWTCTAFIPTFIIRPLGILFVMGIAVYLGYEANAVTAMWAGVISVYLTTILQTIVVRRKLAIEVPKVEPIYRTKDWLLIVLPILLVEGFYVLQTSIDIMLVSAYMMPEDTAVYFASTKILALVHFVYFAVRAAVAHRYTAFHHSGDIEGFRAFVQKTVTWTFWPSLLLALVMVFIAKYFLMLFGAEFVSGEHLVWVLALGIVIRSSVGPAESLLVMAGSQNVCASIYAISLLMNILLNISLIPSLGLMGAAVATTCALAFESAALHAMAKRTLGIHAFIIPERKLITERPV